jgi:acyl carrier protein
MNNTSDIELRIKKVVAECLDIEESSITGAGHLVHDMGGSSLGLVQLVMELETEFDISIPEVDADGLTSLDTITAYVKSKMSNQR